MATSINSNDMMKYNGRADWEVRLEYVGGTSNKYYIGGCDRSGLWFVRYGRIGANGTTRKMAGFGEVHKLIVAKLKKGYKNTVLNAGYPQRANPQNPIKTSPRIRSHGSLLSSPPVGPCAVWLTHVPDDKRIAAIKALRQLYNDLGAPSGLKEAKGIIRGVLDHGKALLVRYISTANGDELDDFQEAAAQIGLGLSYEETPEEQAVNLTYQMFHSVAYVRIEAVPGWEASGHVRWRGYDKKHRKLMVVPDAVVSEGEENLLSATEGGLPHQQSLHVRVSV